MRSSEILKSISKFNSSEIKQGSLLWEKEGNLRYVNLQDNKTFYKIELVKCEGNELQLSIFSEICQFDAREKLKSIFPKTYPYATMILYSFDVAIPSMKFLEFLLNELLLIDHSLSKISSDILSSAGMILAPSLKEWSKNGDFQNLIKSCGSWYLQYYEPKRYNKNVTYKNYDFDPYIREVELFGLEGGSVKLRMRIKSENYSSANSLSKIQFEHRFCFANTNTNDFIWDIPNVAFLESFLTNATKVEHSLKNIAEDVLTSFDSSYISRRKHAFLLGFHNRVGKESTIHSVLKKNTIADPHLIEPIFSYVYPSRGFSKP